jgi:hypothetical protein
MDFSFLSGITNPRVQGTMDMLGRLGNGLQASSQSQTQTPYTPQQPGLAGIQQSAAMMSGAPVKFNSLARPVAGGSMPTSPTIPIPAAPAAPIPTSTMGVS